MGSFSHVCIRERGDKRASGPRRHPRSSGCGEQPDLPPRERVTAESPGSQRRRTGGAGFTRHGLSQRDTLSRPGPASGPSTEGHRRPRGRRRLGLPTCFNFLNNRGGRSIDPIFQRGKQRREETAPGGKWFWLAWNPRALGLGPSETNSRVRRESRQRPRGPAGRGLAGSPASWGWGTCRPW